MIAKALFLAETFYRYEVRMFRDHECRLAEYPGGYLCEGARSFAPLTKAPSGPAEGCPGEMAMCQKGLPGQRASCTVVTEHNVRFWLTKLR